jgi:hypothetical protein
MVRRAALLLLAVGYGAGQLAAVPHAHYQDVAHQRHAARPHVHFGGSSGSHHAHTHAHDAATPDHAALRGVAHHHDDDAVYLQPVVAAGRQASESLADLQELPSHEGWSPFVHSHELVIGAHSVAWQHSRPVITGGHCALFLALQSLRI